MVINMLLIHFDLHHVHCQQGVPYIDAEGIDSILWVTVYVEVADHGHVYTLWNGTVPAPSRT